MKYSLLRRLRANVQLMLFLSVTVFLMLSGSAFAMEGAEHHVPITWRDWLWPIINFAILAFVLVYFARKPVREFFKNRTALIEKSLKEASEARELANKSLEKIQQRLKEADKEVNEILESSRKSGEREKEELIAQGESLKKKMIEQAKANIEFELEKAKKSLKSEAALMALEMAEKQIKERLDKDEQAKLIDEYIGKLEVNR